MNSGGKREAFPLELPWEEFSERRVTIEELRERLANMLPTLMLANLADERSPMLDHSAVADLVKTATGSLDAEARDELVRDLVSIGSWYLLPTARAVGDADLDATREYLSYLSRRGAPAFKALHHVLCLMPSVIEDAIAAEESLASHGAALSALTVKDFLKDVERLLPQIIELVSAKKAGRRPTFVLNHSARLAATAFEEAGLALQAHGHSLVNQTPYFTGTGADAFLAFFRLLAPRVQPATLVRPLLQARFSANKNAAKTETIKVGASD